MAITWLEYFLKRFGGETIPANLESESIHSSSAQQTVSQNAPTTSATNTASPAQQQSQSQPQNSGTVSQPSTTTANTLHQDQNQQSAQLPSVEALHARIAELEKANRDLLTHGAVQLDTPPTDEELIISLCAPDYQAERSNNGNKNS